MPEQWLKGTAGEKMTRNPRWTCEHGSRWRARNELNGGSRNLFYKDQLRQCTTQEMCWMGEKQVESDAVSEYVCLCLCL